MDSYKVCDFDKLTKLLKQRDSFHGEETKIFSLIIERDDADKVLDFIILHIRKFLRNVYLGRRGFNYELNTPKSIIDYILRYNRKKLLVGVIQNLDLFAEINMKELYSKILDTNIKYLRYFDEYQNHENLDVDFVNEYLSRYSIHERATLFNIIYSYNPYLDIKKLFEIIIRTRIKCIDIVEYLVDNFDIRFTELELGTFISQIGYYRKIENWVLEFCKKLVYMSVCRLNPEYSFSVFIQNIFNAVLSESYLSNYQFVTWLLSLDIKITQDHLLHAPSCMCTKTLIFRDFIAKLVSQESDPNPIIYSNILFDIHTYDTNLRYYIAWLIRTNELKCSAMLNIYTMDTLNPPYARDIRRTINLKNIYFADRINVIRPFYGSSPFTNLKLMLTTLSPDIVHPCKIILGKTILNFNVDQIPAWESQPEIWKLNILGILRRDHNIRQLL